MTYEPRERGKLRKYITKKRVIKSSSYFMNDIIFFSGLLSIFRYTSCKIFTMHLLTYIALIFPTFFNKSYTYWLIFLFKKVVQIKLFK